MDDAEEMCWSVMLGDIDTVQELLDEGIDANAKDRKGNSMLGLAATYGQMEIVQLLIDHGADINHQDRYGYTPLINATAVGDADTVDVLLQAGADTQLRDKQGHTALDYATLHRFSEVAALIQRADAARAKPVEPMEKPAAAVPKKGAKRFSL